MNISIIIPAYNAAKTISETLRSLQLQTYVHWEAVIIDDGSKDETAVIANQFAQNDNRIHVITQPNGGVSAARNHGLRIAQNEWILFLDADDWISPEYLQEMTDVLRQNPQLDGVQCGSMYVMPDGDLVNGSHFVDASELFDWFARTCVFCIHAVVLRRTMILDLGGFDSTLRTCEDWDLWQRAARTGAQFGKVEKVMAMYRMRPGSASEDGFQMIKDGIQVITGGHSADPRVKNPKPIHANGRSRKHLSTAILNHVCWTAGLTIGKGQDPRPMLELIKEFRDPQLDSYYVASAIFQAVIQPTCQTYDRWITLWPKFQENILNFFQALEKHAQAEGLAHKAQLHLEKLILEQAETQSSVTVGHTHAVTIEVSKPIPDIETAVHVERLFVRFLIEKELFGFLELPVFDGFVPSHVLADAIADKYGWQILERYFWHTMYGYLRKEDTLSGLTVWRDETKMVSGLAAEAWPNIHDHIGWNLFLQELWRQPTWTTNHYFYAPLKDDTPSELTYIEDAHLTVEITERFPDIEIYESTLFVQVMLAGSMVGTVPILVQNNQVTAHEIQMAIIETCGLELCRVAVREGLIGKPLDGYGTLFTRLLTAVITNRDHLHQLDDVVAATVPSGSAPILNQMLTNRKQLLVAGRHPHGPIGTAVSRRAMLPITAVSHLQNGNIQHPVYPIPKINSHPPQAMIYLPEWPQVAQTSQNNGSESNDLHTHFENIFTNRRDPWQYASPYEQIKFAQTLSLLPDRIINNAIEIGCAEGHFTNQLASYVNNLQASDISELALNRAAERCTDVDNVTFKQIDLRTDNLTGTFDLIVCSEMLYFMGDEATLKQVARKFATSLNANGYLLSAHANLIVDAPDRSGFTWEHPFGSKRIGEIMAQTPGLRLVKEIQTPLYRIHLFQREEPPRFRFRKQKPTVIRHPFQATPLPDHVSQYAVLTDRDKNKWAPNVTERLPILMYHRVAPAGADRLSRYRITPDAFEAQLRFLRDAGFYTVSFDTWQEYAKNKKPLPGRAICLTFDDGYLDFYTYAFPLLKKYNFTATVFIVTDRVGETNAWDAVYGESVPLMNWEQIGELHEQGIQLGSHTATHAHLTALSPTDMVEELLKSRAMLTQKLNTPITTFAYPYGDMDEVVERIIGACGYVYGVTTYHDHCTYNHRFTSMPRLEIEGDDTLTEFAKKLEMVI